MILFLTEHRLRAIVLAIVREELLQRQIASEREIASAQSSRRLAHVVLDELSAFCSSEKPTTPDTIKALQQELCNRKHQIACLKGENKKLREKLKRAGA